MTTEEKIQTSEDNAWEMIRAVEAEIKNGFKSETPKQIYESIKTQNANMEAVELEYPRHPFTARWKEGLEKLHEAENVLNHMLNRPDYSKN
jgi:hypothetical protein